ncbi:hypothetical protein F7018_17040 [Tenacibaculum aiptasiae]|uniref:Uncharacterized protein n=1 Tax=Tenacibaculum aiptasiae TaxID=426481 RepID=A0A7J5A736_9FLAO|nr:hypothetical protein [Tenacibaculum aiptasiae]KAB1153372.1 hypothetical protein F7018_17040 [Tenacibaculum aiptasiae]
MKSNLLLLCSFLLFVNCNTNGVEYIPQKDEKNHIIDFELFSIILPKEFKYKKIDGIDSFVGKIENGTSSFLFDYGRYSPRSPKDKASFIKESQKSMDFMTLQKFLNKINMKPYEDEKGNVNLDEITKKIKNLKLHENNKTVVFQNDKENNCEFYYSLEFEGKEYFVAFCIPEENKKEFKYYKLYIDTIGNYKRTIALWTDKETVSTSSVNFESLNEKKTNGELFIGIRSNTEFNKEELKAIFETVVMR